jgi:hypothetical protein
LEVCQQEVREYHNKTYKRVRANHDETWAAWTADAAANPRRAYKLDLHNDQHQKMLSWENDVNGYAAGNNAGCLPVARRDLIHDIAENKQILAQERKKSTEIEWGIEWTPLSYCVMQTRLAKLDGKSLPRPGSQSGAVSMAVKQDPFPKVGGGGPNEPLPEPAPRTGNGSPGLGVGIYGAPLPKLSSAQIAACSEEIRRTQLASEGWSGDVNQVAARLGQFQKGLFEGRCAGHPEAQAYLAGANKMLAYGGNPSGSGGGAQGGAHQAGAGSTPAPSGDSGSSLPPLASSGNTSASGSSDLGRTTKVHNPAADARSCVQLIQDSQRQGAGTSGNWRFVNNCDSAVELFWCFVQDNSSCREGGTWTVSAGKGWPTFGNKPIKWGACRGGNGGGMDLDSDGGRYTCHLLKW